MAYGMEFGGPVREIISEYIQDRCCIWYWLVFMEYCKENKKINYTLFAMH